MRHELPDDAVTLDTVGVTEEDIGFGVEQIAARRWTSLLATGLREEWRLEFHAPRQAFDGDGARRGRRLRQGGGGGLGRW